MRKSLPLLLIPAMALGACAHNRSAVPDDFSVAHNAPLIIPPDFTLTPPPAGTVTNGPANAQQQAIDAIFGGPAARSAAETSMLDAAGREQADLGIRSTVGDPKTNVVDLGDITRSLLVAPDINTQIASAQVP